ncbi:hypothetical protein [Streptomyces sp. NPDC001492]
MTVTRLTFESPYGCRWCGVQKTAHGRRWNAIVEMHSWVEPSQAMILERMRRRRDARLNAAPPVFHAATAWVPDLDGESADPYCADCTTLVCPRWSRIQTRLDQHRYGLPRRIRRSRKTRATAGGWGGGEPWPF